MKASFGRLSVVLTVIWVWGGSATPSADTVKLKEMFRQDITNDLCIVTDQDGHKTNVCPDTLQVVFVDQEFGGDADALFVKFPGDADFSAGRPQDEVDQILQIGYSGINQERIGNIVSL